jgi:hypothetical protein
VKTTHVPDTRTIQPTAATPFQIPWQTASETRPAATPPERHEVRWRTGRTLHRKRHRTRALAEAFRSTIHQATRNDGEFDTETGLPDLIRPTTPLNSAVAPHPAPLTTPERTT